MIDESIHLSTEVPGDYSATSDRFGFPLGSICNSKPDTHLLLAYFILTLQPSSDACPPLRSNDSAKSLSYTRKLNQRRALGFASFTFEYYGALYQSREPTELTMSFTDRISVQGASTSLFSARFRAFQSLPRAALAGYGYNGPLRLANSSRSTLISSTFISFSTYLHPCQRLLRIRFRTAF